MENTKEKQSQSPGAQNLEQKREEERFGFDASGLEEARSERDKRGGGYKWIEQADETRRLLLEEKERLDKEAKRLEGATVGPAVDPEELDKIYASQRILHRRISEWNILSSIKKGSEYDKLKNKAEEIAKKKKRAGKEDKEGIESKDEAREALLRELSEKITEDEISKEREAMRIEEEEQKKGLRRALFQSLKESLDELKNNERQLKENKVEDRGNLITLIEGNYENLENLYRQFTGKELKKEATERAKQEIEKEGGRVWTVKDFRESEEYRRMIETTKRRLECFERRTAINNIWLEMLPGLTEDERRAYRDEKGNATKKFLEVVNKRIEESGLPPQVFYRLVNQGFVPDKIKEQQVRVVGEQGAWKKLLNFFGFKKYEHKNEYRIIPSADGLSSIMVSVENWEEWKRNQEKQLEISREQLAKQDAEQRIYAGVLRFKQRIRKHEKQMVEETNEENKEKNRKKAPVDETEPIQMDVRETGKSSFLSEKKEEEPAKGIEPVRADAKVNKGISRIEDGDASFDLKGAGGFKSFIVKWGKRAGASLYVLLGLAATAILKTVETSAYLLQGIAENPKKPGKWLEPLKQSFKKDKK